MKVVISIDSFKGSISSLKSANAVDTALKKVFPDTQAVKIPLADGGEGTVDALCQNKKTVKVCGPLGKPVYAQYGIAEDGTAIIEMAAAAGITLLKASERNPMHTTTFGVGELILDAINNGCRNFIIGIGGSATNDGGVGMLSALGYKFLDKANNPVISGAAGLKNIVSFDDIDVDKRIFECNFNVACDVDNPLCGINGCSAIYGPQKGASSDDIMLMDKWLKRFADIVKSKYIHADDSFPGAGAAGGLGFAFQSFLNANLKPGVETIINHTRIEDEIADADLVITGEGRLDNQSVMGKAPIGVAKLAKKYGVPVIAFCGCLGEGAKECNLYGIDAYFPILQNITTLEQAMDEKQAYCNLYNTAEQVFKLIKSIKNV